MAKYFVPFIANNCSAVVEYFVPDPLVYTGQNYESTNITLTADTSTIPTTSGYIFVDWDNSLLGWWKGNSVTNLSPNVPRFERANDKDLIVNGTLHYTNNGPFGTAFNLASGNLVASDSTGGSRLIEDKWYIGQNKSFTMSMWINKKDNTVTTYPGYLHKNSVSLFWHGSKRWQAKIAPSYSVGELAQYILYVPPVASSVVNNWTQVAITYNCSTKLFSLYTDGSYRTSLTYTGDDFANVQSFYIGDSSNYGDKISDILIFNRCLGSGEIYNLYQKPSSNFTVTFSGCQPLKEYNYTIYAVDGSGNITNYGNQIIRSVVPSSIPTVVLTGPAYGARSENPIRTFRFTAISTNLESTLSSAQLWFDYGGIHHLEATQSLSGTSGDYSFNINNITTSGNYRWNCYVTDSMGYGGFASQSGLFKVGQSTYYIATSGNDSNPGTIDAPYLTIQKFASTAYPGDSCYIRGGTYRETVIPVNSGGLYDFISFNNYPGETVKITGADILSSGWVWYSGNIYTTDMTWTLGSGNNQVFVGDTAILEARYPASAEHYWQGLYYGDPHQIPINSGLIITGWDVVLYSSGIILNQPNNFWVGATVRGNWDYKGWSGTVLTSQSGQLVARGHINPDRVTRGGVANMYIAGDCLNAMGYSGIYINSSGEFYHNSNTNKLYFIAPNYVDPSTLVVEAKKRRYGFDLRSNAYISISGINLFACNLITSEKSSHIYIDRMNAKYVSHFIWLGKILDPDGYYTASSSPGPTTSSDTKGQRSTGILLLGKNNRISNSNIEWSCGDGIRLLQDNSSVLKCNVSNCNYAIVQCANINIWNFLTPSYNIVVSGCYLYRSGTVLLYHGDNKASKIIYNVITGSRYSNEADDLGAVYSIASCGGKYDRTEIAYNTLSGVRECGLYQDGYSFYYHIHHNLIYDLTYGGNVGGWGMQFATPAENHLVAHNTLCNTFLTGSKGAVINKYGSQSCSGTIFANNILAGFSQSSAWSGATFINNALTGHTNLISYGGQPLYIDPSGDNYHLHNQSTVIYSGINLGYTVDLDGIVLHNPPSVGCYEYIPY